MDPAVGQKRGIESISTSLSPTEELAESLRSIGWKGENQEAQTFFSKLAATIQNFSKGFPQPQIPYRNYYVIRNRVIDYIETARVLIEKKEDRFNTTSIFERFFINVFGKEEYNFEATYLLFKDKVRSNFDIMAIALTRKNFDAVDILMKYGVIIRTIPKECLFHPVDNKKWDCNSAENLIKRANINCLDLTQQSILHYAALGEISEGQLKFLLASGANINQRCKGGGTPLHVAAMVQNLPVVKLLVEYEAEIDPVDDSGNTPLHSTFKADQAVFLIEEGADPTIKNKKGNCFFDRAKQDPVKYAEVLHLWKEMEPKRIA